MQEILFNAHLTYPSSILHVWLDLLERIEDRCVEVKIFRLVMRQFLPE
jgi:hypothetical protein